ncbi:MAG: hypothetical protein J6Y08_09150 [Clostridiales bacterium]|nr:hypothetical protein [Clostridiales bacterium]
MGFLDNFKEAMNRGKEAAANYRAREMGNQAQRPQGNPQANKPMTPGQAIRAAKAQQGQVPKVPAVLNPNEPFNFVAKTATPIEVTHGTTGRVVRFNVLSNGVAKLMDPNSYPGQNYKQIAIDTILETVKERLSDPAFLPDPTDLKSLMLLSHNLVPIATEALKGKGFQVMFKMLNVTPQADA